MGCVVLCKCRHIYVLEATKMHMWKQINGKQPFCSHHCRQKIHGLPFSKAWKSETIPVNRNFIQTTNQFHCMMLLFEILQPFSITHICTFSLVCCVRQQHLLHSRGEEVNCSVCQVSLTAFKGVADI